MRTDYKVAIVGGGASGLLCAVELLKGDNALRGENVLIAERNERVGKKLVATGNGQGNFTNSEVSDNHFYGDKLFIKTFLKNSLIDLPAYFGDLGVPLVSESDGRYYPLSKQASSSLDIIRKFLNYKNCDVFTSTFVKTIDFKNNVFKLTFADGNTVRAERLVIATGGCAGKQFGTDGFGYRLAEKFGHKTTKLAPSLVQVKTETRSIKGLKGIKERVGLSLCDGERFISSCRGDLLFTDYGVSGNSVFSLSSKIEELKNPFFSIDFLPSYSPAELEELLSKRLNTAYIGKDDLLTGIINKKTGQSILKDITKPTAETITRAVKNFRLKIIGTLGFDYAQVTKGGIDTRDVDPLSMQSKLNDSLFLIGEILNVDGDCGGYNLTFAFSSGIIAAKNIKTSFGVKSSQ